jgi:aminoglycoside phosphotransferase (APT) family kinase protein
VTGPDPELEAFLVDSGLAQSGTDAHWTPLSGGVSSDIWRVECANGVVCVKRPLAKLKVAADWQAPITRNAAEWDYLQWVDRIAPGHVPRPVVRDAGRNVFAMQWLLPEHHRLWKPALLSGHADPNAAAAVGDLLGRIHAASARDPVLPARFATDENFHALRIAPYLLELEVAHPDLSHPLTMIADRTAATRKVLVHGDVSPKNILLGPNGPVLLDAECAWFGDPAFDLAFCLNHLAIKQRIVTGAEESLRRCFERMRVAYLARVDWEPTEDLEMRAATLLAALALARVDGKSPLEYLDASQRGALSAAARAALLAAPATLNAARALLTSN